MIRLPTHDGKMIANIFGLYHTVDKTKRKNVLNTRMCIGGSRGVTIDSVNMVFQGNLLFVQKKVLMPFSKLFFFEVISLR